MSPRISHCAAVIAALTVVSGVASQTAAQTLAQIGGRPCSASTLQNRSGGARSFERYVRGQTPDPAGAEADPLFPFGVKLSMTVPASAGAEYHAHCGGTILNQRWILTAAHCLKDDFAAINISLASASLQGSQVIRRSAHVAVCHLDSDTEGLLRHDVALIRLSEPLPAGLQTAVLERPSGPPLRPGAILYGGGWRVGQRGPDDVMRRQELRVKRVERDGFITLAAADGGSDGLCRGESGGPLIVRDGFGSRQVGVLSGVQKVGFMGPNGYEYCMTPGYEMYFTPVAPYYDWIQSVMRYCDGAPWNCAVPGPRPQGVADAAPAPQAVPARGLRYGAPQYRMRRPAPPPRAGYGFGRPVQQRVYRSRTRHAPRTTLRE